MSFILDALRKSELERQRQSGPSIAEFPIARPDRRLPVALLAIGLLLALNVGIVLFFLLRDGGPRAAEPAAVPVAATTPAASPQPAPAEAAPAPATPPASDHVPGEELTEPPYEAFAGPATLPPQAPDPTLLPEAPAHSPGVVYGEEAAGAVDAEVPPGLPELAVDLHIFADDRAKRAVFINGRRYVEGAQIAEGPVVEEITRDGAVLRHRGQRFLLPRL